MASVTIQYFELATSIFLVVAGWVVNQILARRSQRRNERIRYLIEAYRLLESASNRDESKITGAHAKDIERSIADIYLFGSLQEVQRADEFLKSMKDGRSNLDPLLDVLCEDLRKELMLEELPKGHRKVIRMQ